MNENKDNLLTSLKKDLEKELENFYFFLKKNKKQAESKNAEKIKNLESKLTKFYYWLFGIFFVLLIIISGMFFYSWSSFGGK